MIKKKKLFIQILGISLIAQSCNIMYTPNMQNVPLLTEKNEVRATLGPFDYQAAYAVTNNIGVMLNGQYHTRNTNSYDYTNESNSLNNSKSTLIEGGIGFIGKLSENSVFEVYGGYGMGKNSTFDKYTDYTTGSLVREESFTAKTNRFFLQPSIGFTNEYFDIAFSSRLMVLNFSNIDTLNYTSLMLVDQDLLNIDKEPFVFIEPAVTMRVGYKWVKFQAQMMYSFKYNATPLNYMPLTMTIGVHFDLAPRNFKKSEPKNVSSVVE